MSYDQLIAYARQTEALSQVAGRLGWDQETVMPRGAAPQRAEELAAMEHVLHARRSAPELGDMLASVTPETDLQAAQIREIRRSYDRATKIPADLAGEIARVTSLSQGEWAEARAVDSFADFAARLSEVVSLKREEAAALADGGDLYDALLADFEPGATGDRIETMFAALRPRLVALRDKVRGVSQPSPLEGSFPEAAQMALSQDLATRFGYDLNTGRIDKAVHPFSSGSGLDVRITTRTDEQDPFNAIYSTIHEVGHAVYEQQVDPAYGLTPIGQGASMGVHESQSRICENQLGRGAAFTGWLYDRLTEAFGPISVTNAEAFARTVNRVSDGFIRTEADEVQYNLHVMLRFDLERALMGGSLDVADLEEAWNTRFKADFGIDVPKASLGVLQDVHWSVGLFGYFPTYTLGNVYAGCLYQKMAEDLPGLDADLARGDPSAALAWLRIRLQVHGALRDGEATIHHATGQTPTEAPLLDYLETKFTALYGL